MGEFGDWMCIYVVKWEDEEIGDGEKRWVKDF